MTPQELENLAHLRRARDLIDRDYAKPLDVPTMAREGVHVAVALLAAIPRRVWRDALQLPDDAPDRASHGAPSAGSSVTDTCMAVGCTSLGSFSSRFAEIVGESPTSYRAREHLAVKAMPACVAKTRTRPVRSTSSRIGEAERRTAA
jgi:AraC-like DNA-binding protein